jgi:regulator of protease activity HflC (stomatin/prohibitin superfamily)
MSRRRREHWTLTLAANIPCSRIDLPLLARLGPPARFGRRRNKLAAPHDRLLINIAHIPRELAAGSVKEFDPHPVHPERRPVALFSPRSFYEVLALWTEQYCSAKHPDMDQYPGSQGELSRKEPKMNPITAFLAIACVAIGAVLGVMGYFVLGAASLIAAIVIGSALKMANTWQKFVILRAGKLRGVKGAGLFLIIPVIDNVVAIIDERIQTTAFSAEEALTKDTVPVNVDAIIFWFVHDAQKAALNITNYREAIDRVAQTSLREMIGSSMLSALLSERTAADELLRSEIGRKTADWGISVKSVEIRDVAIPVALQDAMSRQAQAEREKQARVILGSAEAAIAGKFVEAAVIYAGQPAALQLRAMNIIYETTKERGTTILMPTSMVDSMNPVVALALAGQDKTASADATGPLPLRNPFTQQKNASKIDETSLALEPT